MKMILTTALLPFVLLAFGCIRQEQSQSHSDIVRGALSNLLTRPSGAFVIIEEPRSGKFVQFVGSKDEPIILDLPSQTLSPAEMTKAKSLFAELGHPGPETRQMQEYPGGPPADWLTTFNVEFGADVDKATELAIAVLHRVYDFNDDVTLKVTED